MAKSEREYVPPGMICEDCGERHYYDFLDKPEPHEGSGLCWNCWAHRQMNQPAQLAH